jgi:hypothetical protein
VIGAGGTAIVGAAAKGSDRGAAYVFARNGTAWTLLAKLAASDGSQGDYFGGSLALEGHSILAGAYGQANYTGAVYSYANLNSPANLTVSPNLGPPFTTLTLTGSEFSPNETVRFDYNGVIPLGTGTADAGGAFTATGSFRSAPYGTGFIRAVGMSSGLYGAANFAVVPRLMTNPNNGTPGSTVLVQGFGFGAGETVRIYWQPLHVYWAP